MTRLLDSVTETTWPKKGGAAEPEAEAIAKTNGQPKEPIIPLRHSSAEHK